MEKNKSHEVKGGNGWETTAQYGLIAILLILILYNVLTSYGTTGNSVGIPSVSAAVIPDGIPDIYGEELGVNYNDVNPNDPRLADATIKKLSAYEDLDLSETQMNRYIKIAGAISCEYCCGAKSIIFSNGERACGCAHSYAMRGLAKYLISNHPDMSDEDILREIGKWKVLFFPGIHEQKAQILESKGIDSSDYINLASNLYRGIEKGQTSGGGMVGGC